jgi:AraC-like DNA-binding protein
VVAQLKTSGKDVAAANTKESLLPLRKAAVNTLSAGNYLGNKVDTYFHKRIIVSKTDYCFVENKDWHCHENPFFAYFLKGGNYEYRKGKEIICSAGTLLFYQSQEPHCNKAYAKDCKILHVEIDKLWSSEYDLKTEKIRADVIGNPIIKNAFANILREFATRDELTGSSIEHLLMYLFILLTRSSGHDHPIPSWVKKFDIVVRDCIAYTPTLENISKLLNIHPVTLSKEFYKHYQCSFGDYIRHLKIEKSLPLLAKKNMPVNDVSFHCGFSDTSNFIRTFKKLKGVTPTVYRQFL